MSAARSWSTAPQTRARIEAVIAGLTNPDHKRMLQVWLRHWWGEVEYDLTACLATVTEDISYRWYGTDQIGDGLCEDSIDFARRLYQSQFELQLMPGGPFDQERWAFADWGLTLQGVFTTALPGSMLKGKSAQPDPNGLYLVRWPMVVCHPFDRERWLMRGEIMYGGEPVHIEPTNPAMIRYLLGRKG